MKERRKNGESTVSIERILNAYDKRPLYSRGDINVGVIQGALREYISDGRKLTQETDRSALELKPMKIGPIKLPDTLPELP